MLQIPEKIYNDIDLVLEPPDKRKEAIISQINLVVDEIKNLVSAQKKSEEYDYDLAELFYLLGYVLYYHPERIKNPAIYQEVEKSFLSALEIDHEYPMAWLYFGYNAYDKEQYSEAQQRFLMVKKDSLDPFWNLKLLEIKLCCSIKLDGLDASLDKLETFVEEAEKLPVEDVYPLSLDKVIEECKASLVPANRLRFTCLLKKLDKAAHWGIGRE